METQLFTQPKAFDGKDYSLGEHIKQLLTSKRPKYSEISLYFGLVKENAYEKLYESFKSFIINGGNINFYLSSDKKSNAKKIINSLLELGCNVYLFTGAENDYIPDFQYKGVVASSLKKVIVLLSSGNFSLSGLYEGHNVITEFSYDLSKDKQQYDDFSKTFLPEYTINLFKNVTRSNIDELLQQNKSILSIEEFTKKDVDSIIPITTSTDDLLIDIEIDKDVDFLVPEESLEKPKKEKKSATAQKLAKAIIPEPVEAIEFKETKYYVDDDALDIENMLFSNSAKPVPKAKISKPEQPSEEPLPEGKIIAKTANLAQTSIFMLQLPKISKRGASAGEIKVPVYLRDLIPLFWGWPKEYKVEKNSIEKARICKFNIIDTSMPNITIEDEKAKLFQREGENSFIILSDELIKMDLQENDIIRFIKTQSKNGFYYTCEIIRQGAKEYPIWEQFCTSLLKGSKRKYGIM